MSSSSLASSASSIATPVAHYLQLAHDRLQAARRDMPRMIDMGGKMALPLLNGGRLFIAPVAPWWPSEVCSRAGGMMGIEGFSPGAPRAGDVVAFVMPTPQADDEKSAELRQGLAAGPAHLFAVADDKSLEAAGIADRVDAATGGIDTASGFGRFSGIAPLAPVWPLDTLLRGWIVQGEMITACIRAGRMPIMYMSVWLEGAFVRNASFRRSEPLVEPFNQPFFHQDRYVPPLAPGYAGHAFLDAIELLHGALVDQVDRLTRAAAMCVAALQAGRRVRAVLIGHAYPRIMNVETNAVAGAYPIEWGRSMSHVPLAVPDDFGCGDVLLHMGYGPVDPADVRAILDRGIRLIHTTPYGRRPGLPDHDCPDHPDFLWFDLPWRPADATVDIPGYSVRMLPASSSAHTMAYFTILCEMAEKMGWH